MTLFVERSIMGYITCKKYMKKHYKKQIDALQRVLAKTEDVLLLRIVEDCVHVAANGGSIVVTALGKNVPVAEKFVATLNSVGINAVFLHTNSAFHGDLGKVKKGDLVIVLSKSGETEETVFLCEHLKNRETVNWLVTCHRSSTCIDMIDNTIVLDIGEEGDPWNLMPHNSTVSFLVLLQSLAMSIVDELQIPIDVLKSNHPGGHIGKKLNN